MDKKLLPAGPAPESSAWNRVPGGHLTEDAIKDSLNNPASYELVRSSKPWAVCRRGRVYTKFCIDATPFLFPFLFSP